ncbi:hypothetical protein MCOR07_006317 [Pyricularia oryzae]|nr:hypothetical protein MCOR30_003384 [Pyricularia oryzae]KAI6524591.1 hypothetical protein MCOR05_009695 [Pyricularia oryzae]KAI6595758.1 hypothetical protein MCOR12_006404 [Pyricularia oryzae]KAI6618827.1 hypothetical protein MCOR07_006317 [Pyricularia oryzae]
MATSIGRLQAALSSVTSEVTVAAANINFDFTLVKCEAPAEYRSLEQQLTPARKAEAECGSLHVTARRLGALFEEICPVAPRLIGAFGKRASEITQKANQKSTPLPSAARSIFSDYIGVDICALWAAATSSKAALPLFLLACMLARIWDDAEATALWCEIVKDRRMDIASRLEAGEPVPYTAVSAAAQQDIPREQLAKWDASARAFLKTADDTWSMQQKQFNLIAHNIDVPVNRGNDQRPYHGIVATWTNAMKTLEKLICGQPHAVLDGSILLGISSWHIYPDMTVFGSGPGKHVMMRDSLVNSGGVISVGVKYSSPLGPGSQHGVFWSLSLGHYKFYGKPTNKVSRLNEDRSRLTFSELQVATIGALLSHWNIPVAMTEGALKCLLKIVSFLPYDAEDRSDVWIKILTDSLVMCLSESENTAALISLGRRRSVFISSEDRPGNRRANQATKYFGLTKPPYHLLDLMEDAAGFGSSYGGVTVATLGLDDREAWEIGPVEANNDDKLGLGVLRGSTKYRHLIGRLSSVAVFVIDDNGDDIRLPILEHEDITGCIDCGLISPKALKSALTGRNFKLEEKLDDELLVDPSKSPNIEDFEVGRLLGSFGNSGLTILQNLDPNELMARELDACAWRVTLGKFSGEPRDDFTKTSLHLGFTGWQAPVFGEQSIGMHFPSANLLQVFVSVRDSGEWVADVDILGMLMHKDVIYLKSNQTCTHQGQRGKTGAASAVDSLPEGILSVETWDQILDLPEGWVVARAYGNWVSRLAIASVAALHCRLREKRVYICPQDKDWCWLCLEEEHRNAIFVY